MWELRERTGEEMRKDARPEIMGKLGKAGGLKLWGSYEGDEVVKLWK